MPVNAEAVSKCSCEHCGNHIPARTASGGNGNSPAAGRLRCDGGGVRLWIVEVWPWNGSIRGPSVAVQPARKQLGLVDFHPAGLAVVTPCQRAQGAVLLCPVLFLVAVGVLEAQSQMRITNYD